MNFTKLLTFLFGLLLGSVATAEAATDMSITRSEFLKVKEGSPAVSKITITRKYGNRNVPIAIL